MSLQCLYFDTRRYDYNSYIATLIYFTTITTSRHSYMSLHYFCCYVCCLLLPHFRSRCFYQLCQFVEIFPSNCIILNVPVKLGCTLHTVLFQDVSAVCSSSPCSSQFACPQRFQGYIDVLSPYCRSLACNEVSILPLQGGVDNVSAPVTGAIHQSAINTFCSVSFVSYVTVVQLSVIYGFLSGVRLTDISHLGI